MLLLPHIEEYHVTALCRPPPICLSASYDLIINWSVKHVMCIMMLRGNAEKRDERYGCTYSHILVREKWKNFSQSPQVQMSAYEAVGKKPCSRADEGTYSTYE